jgi:hypothetical protein
MSKAATQPAGESTSLPSLPSFIQRAMAFFGIAEKHFTTAAEQLTKSQADLAAAVAEKARLQGELDQAKQQVTDLQGAIVTKDSSIEQLKKDVIAAQNSAGAKANQIAAAAGVPVEQLPAAAPAADAGGVQGETAWQKYNRLLATEPRAAGVFYASNAADIFKTRTS